jgi:hypothetical protein
MVIVCSFLYRVGYPGARENMVIKVTKVHRMNR